MNIGSGDRNSAEKHGPLIDKLRRQMTEAGGREIPSSVYQAQNAHWSANYATRPYVDAGKEYDEYAPAYLYGVFWYYSDPDRSIDASEGDLARGWDDVRGDSSLDWPSAKPAVREAWYQVSDLAERARAERAELLAHSPPEHTPGDE
jgi:hypothetical protein